MSGIYIHIPFCKKKCYYCDFYTTNALSYKKEYIEAIKLELNFRKNYISDKNIKTIYFGGGTPSLLDSTEIENIIEEISKYFYIEKNTEITLEANPDDLSIEYLKKIKNSSINRLSIGFQSFDNNDLKLMNRRHTSEESIECVNNAISVGFNNISGDLIYGLPDLSEERWKKNLDIFFSLNLQHLSAYHLGIEENTVFKKLVKNGKLLVVNEDISIKHYEVLINEIIKHDFIQYEISNFGLPGYFSMHNSSYWQAEQYLGLGTSAHSYNQINRQWNVSNLKTYLEKINSGNSYFEREILSLTDKYNDYIITSLRTIYGISALFISQQFGKIYEIFFIQNIEKYIISGKVEILNDLYVLTSRGKFISDKIIEDLFYTKI